MKMRLGAIVTAAALLSAGCSGSNEIPVSTVTVVSTANATEEDRGLSPAGSSLLAEVPTLSPGVVEFRTQNPSSLTSENLCSAIDIEGIRRVMYDVPDLTLEPGRSVMFPQAPVCVINTSAYMGAFGAIGLLERNNEAHYLPAGEDITSMERDGCKLYSTLIDLHRLYECTGDYGGRRTPGYTEYINFLPEIATGVKGSSDYVLRTTFALGGSSADRPLGPEEVKEMRAYLSFAITGG